MISAPQLNLGDRNEDAFIELVISIFEWRIANSILKNQHL